MNGFFEKVGLKTKAELEAGMKALFSRRSLVVAGSAALLGACSVIPKSEPSSTGPVADPAPRPAPTALPTGSARHRIALLVPLSADDERTAQAGQSLANAVTMALLDTGADNIRITTYDTGGGAGEAAEQAIVDGNRLILGPLIGQNVPAVQAQARGAGVPVVSFSNNIEVASADVFLMGYMPEQSVKRSVEYAASQGSNQFAILAPDNTYGDRAYEAFREALESSGGNLVARETYDPGNTSIISAAQRLRTGGGYDTVLIADRGSRAAAPARELKREGAEGTRILGTERWAGEAAVARSAVLDGAIYSTVSEQRLLQFVDSYKQRFGDAPDRLATLGYDAVLLTIRMTRDWPVGTPFPTRELYNSGGFLGIDGPFRFDRNGIAQRALEVRRIENGKIITADPAPASFDQ
jgi:ABC-type branched-subunit amino acid transport system substrate-binding protein